MREDGEIYTTGKNFTLPPAVTPVTNLTSGCRHTRMTIGDPTPGNPKVRGIFEVQPFIDLMRQRRENELPIFCKTCSRYEGTADHRVQLLDEATVEIKILDDKILQLLLQPLSCNQTEKSSGILK